MRERVGPLRRLEARGADGRGGLGAQLAGRGVGRRELERRVRRRRVGQPRDGLEGPLRRRRGERRFQIAQCQEGRGEVLVAARQREPTPRVSRPTGAGARAPRRGVEQRGLALRGRLGLLLRRLLVPPHQPPRHDLRHVVVRGGRGGVVVRSRDTRVVVLRRRLLVNARQEGPGPVLRRVLLREQVRVDVVVVDRAPREPRRGARGAGERLEEVPAAHEGRRRLVGRGAVAQDQGRREEREAVAGLEVLRAALPRGLGDDVARAGVAQDLGPDQIVEALGRRVLLVPREHGPAAGRRARRAIREEVAGGTQERRVAGVHALARREVL